MRRFFADTFALIVFSTVAGAAVEVIFAGLTIAQTLQARVTAIPVILLTARPYGLYRDWIFRVSHADQSGQVWRAIADIAAFMTFQVPVYVAILILAGASVGQIVTACATAVVIMAVSGRPYGLFLDLCRQLFGVEKLK
jgi:hypothetical protein